MDIEDGSPKDQQMKEYTRMLPYETTTMNLERKKVFHLVMHETADIEKAIVLANIHNNIKYLGCTYPAELTDELEDIMVRGQREMRAV